MADVSKRMYGPAIVTGSNVSVYTAPAAGAVIRNIHVANTTLLDATITVALDGTSATAANHFLSALNVPANGTYDWSGFCAVGNVGTIQILSGTASALSITISGVEL